MIAVQLDLEHPDVQAMLPSVRYAPSTVAYQRKYMAGWQFESEGFMLLKKERCIAAFICALGKAPKDASLALDAWGQPAVFLRSQNWFQYRNEIRTVTKKYLKDLVKKFPTATLRFQEYISEQGLSPIAEILLKSGNSPENIFDITIPLNIPENILWSHIHKSYKALIHNGEREFQLRIVDSSSVTPQDIEAFRLLHKTVSGRSTRSQDSWHQQYENIKANNAFAIFIFLHGELIGASYFILSPHRCYYGVGAYKRELFDRPISHVAIWHGISEAKRRGMSFFDVGRWFPCFQGTEKERSISFFKRGFGGLIKTSLLFSTKEIAALALD